MQLHRTIKAFASAISQEFDDSTTSSHDLFTAISICNSAQFILYDMHTCAVADMTGGIGMAEQLEMQGIALANLKELCLTIHQFANKIASVAESGGLLKMSPFVADSLYQACMNFIWYIRETGRTEHNQAVIDIKKVLLGLGRRWVVSSQSISISKYTLHMPLGMMLVG